MSTADHDLDTRQRLIEAAGEVFAEVGFHTATIRDIAQRANANIAAIGYYFRDKQGLYAEAIRHVYRDDEVKHPPTPGVDASAPPADRLRAFVRGFMFRLFDPARPAWHGRLMSREMFEPTAALDHLVNERIRPRYEILLGIVGELLGAAASEERIRLSVNSVIGQCLHYHHARHTLERLQPECSYGPHNIGHVAEHVSRFSLGGIEALARSAGGDAP